MDSRTLLGGTVGVSVMRPTFRNGCGIIYLKYGGGKKASGLFEEDCSTSVTGGPRRRSVTRGEVSTKDLGTSFCEEA